MRDINLLHPDLQILCRRLIQLAAQNGIEIIIVQTLRTAEEQNALYAQGRTVAGDIVTNVRYPYSMHNWGLAFDFAVIIDGKANWERTDLYQKVGELGKSLGLRWGGDFKTLKDMPHFEMVGFEINKLIERYQTPEKYVATFAKEAKRLFADLVNHWAEKDVRRLAELGIVQPAEKYRPQDPITRAEAAAMVARAIEYIMSKTEALDTKETREQEES